MLSMWPARLLSIIIATGLFVAIFFGVVAEYAQRGLGRHIFGMMVAVLCVMVIPHLTRFFYGGRTKQEKQLKLLRAGKFVDDRASHTLLKREEKRGRIDFED